MGCGNGAVGVAVGAMWVGVAVGAMWVWNILILDKCLP